MDLRKLKGRVALVTGAASGIGAALAVELARRGASLALITRSNEEGLEKVASECRALGSDVLAELLDVTDTAATTLALKRIVERFGKVDILINNAGVGLTGEFLETSVDDWRWLLETNLWSAVHIVRALLPAMVTRGEGYILNVASGAALIPMSRNTAYAASKAALVAFSESLRREVGPSGVVVTTACPGFVNTPMAQTSRLRGTADAPHVRARMARLFAQRGTSPERTARQIVSAMEKKKGLATVASASPLYFLRRMVPGLASLVLDRQVAAVLKPE